MQDELLRVIRHINAEMLSRQIAAGRATALFLTGKDGGHINYYAYRKYFRENALRTIKRDVTSHILRHTHASLLMEQSIDIESISRRLGHSDSRITKEIFQALPGTDSVSFVVAEHFTKSCRCGYRLITKHEMGHVSDL